MYYNIRLDWDPKVIGVKNGIYQVELDNTAYQKKDYTILESLFINNEFTAKQEYPELHFKFCFRKLKSAKKTSFMSFTPYLNHVHFLIHNKVLDLLKDFNVQKYKDYEAVIYDSPTENIDNNYRLFFCVLQDWNVIDFENTVFTSGGFVNNPKIDHKFSDENEMKKFNGIVKVKTLALSKSFDNSLDFFLTRLGGLFVSEKLKSALEAYGATGIKFNNGEDA
ncbi:imm11 family protein [Sphingobacterium endophyticum]|uniref:imm11 family protein n=1 Tax=Sphingobacterium endophyticum TaxID=2546448 RepID=UPI0012E1719E|nr:hypothetical protein [Sphingobacterium endophyticum]